MANQSGRGASGAYESESVIPFAPTDRNAISNDASQLDSAGQAIMRLLHKAAGVAEANSQQALDMATKLSNQLRGAEDRIAELEADAQNYQERAERAEQWLHKIYTDVEERFIKRPAEKHRGVLESIGRRA
jgi:molecular chaperone GrpE (heat shock protein)